MGKLTNKILKRFKKFRKNYDSNRNIFLVCIAIVMIWRGIWDLLDMYIFPNHPLFSNLICITIGVVILLVDDGNLGELKTEDPHRENISKKKHE